MLDISVASSDHICHHDTDFMAELGANLHTPNNSGSTPACKAAQNGHESVIRALAELGANLNTPNNKGATPVIYAAKSGHVASVRALAELGADLNTPNKSGSTPACVAAQNGHEATVRALAELGANLNTPNNKGATPAIIAAKNGHVASLKALAELDADLNTSNNEGVSAVYAAACKGHLEIIKVLASRRVNIDLVSNGVSPLMAAVLAGHTDVSMLLVNIGADVKLCLKESAPPGVNHIRDMMSQFCTSMDSSQMSIDGDGTDNGAGVKYALFSLTNLLSSAKFDFCSIDQSNAADASSGDDATSEWFKTHVAISMQNQLLTEDIEGMQATCYVLKRRLVLIGWRVFQSTLLVDGDRVSAVTKTRRYTELVCFLFDSTMLGDVLSLRLTCKSNSERRRFPVYLPTGDYHELEANLIEEWVSFGSSRFVSTDIIHAVLAMHFNNCHVEQL